MSRSRISAAQRLRIAERARGCCEYCHSQAAFATQSFAVEHIVPVSKGGTSALSNLALSCPGCNGHKYTKTHGIDPVDQREVLLFHPRRQTWDEHFAWDASYTQMLGLTPTGRATVKAL